MPNASGGGVFGTGFFVMRLICGSGRGLADDEYLFTGVHIYAFPPRPARPPSPAYSTRSNRGLGWYVRPTFALGLPSTSTTSAVKSNRPW